MKEPPSSAACVSSRRKKVTVGETRELGGLETVDRPAGPRTSCQAIGRGTKGSLKVGSLPDSCNE